MTMSDTRQRIGIIFHICESKQKEYASVRDSPAGNGCAVSDRSAFVTPCGFLVSVCVISKAYKLIQQPFPPVKGPVPLNLITSQPEGVATSVTQHVDKSGISRTEPSRQCS